ncbi:DUF72 domain-containing protein [Granulicella sibirica]|uniref:DUF72 domain-containing protein n=1 Tax=Granulicella sibirica TaxID=2479048 RepID=A0A4Q0STI1_9BACT|nr:DUF72 domain-containing protein [Granulicella sibirica]RXH54283.1 hypothetical protein GRAN_4579 [Granulicella sibirica]
MAPKTKIDEPLPLAPSPTNVFAGTSGWAYPTWKPGFYPAGLAAKRFLPFYASRLNSVEVNYTFRAFPTATMLEGWLAATPANFRFSFKAPQQITHFSRLQKCDAAVEQFIRVLEPVRQAGKLGLLLFQLPPNLKMDLDRLEAFLNIPILQAAGRPSIAFEFRHESWFVDSVYERLHASKAALCVAESDDLASPEVHPADGLACFRLRRTGGYSEAEVEAFAQKLSDLAKTREVYAYFKHEDDPSGAWNATTFLKAAAEMDTTH